MYKLNVYINFIYMLNYIHIYILTICILYYSQHKWCRYKSICKASVRLVVDAIWIPDKVTQKSYH